MVDFNGFDKGVIGKKLPADTTLNCMRKAELIDLLHLAEENHRVLAEAYKIAADTSKCNICPLHLDTRKVEDIKTDERKKFDKVINDMREWINSGNRNNCDYLIVDKIEEIIVKYEKEQKGDAENDNRRMPETQEGI